MPVRPFLFIVFWTLTALLCPTSWANEDSELWLSADIKFLQKNKSTFYFYLETRSGDNGSDLLQYFFGPRYNQSLTEHWSMGAAIKSMHLKRNDHFDDLYRLEVESIYADTFGGKGKLDFRNRVENIFEDNKDNILRYRTRIRYRYPLENDLFKTLFFSQELFYTNIDHNWTLSQSRFIPFGLDFHIGNKRTLSVFYLHETKIRPNLENDKINVLGVYFTY